MAVVLEQSPAWPVVRAGSYRADLDQALFDSEIAAVVLDGFLGAGHLDLVNSRIDRLEAQRYSAGLADLASRGPRQWQGAHIHNRRWYLSGARQWAHAAISLYQGTPAATGAIIEVLAEGCPRRPRVAIQSGEPYATSTVLTLGKGADLHYDRASEDGPGWAIAEAAEQLGVNLYLRNSSSGGELTIFCRRGRPHPDAPGNYGFPHYVSASARRVVIRPEAGDLIFFNSGLYHRVDATPEVDGRRSVANFAGRTASGETLIWS